MENTAIQLNPRRLWSSIIHRAMTIIIVLIVLVIAISLPTFTYRRGLENGIGKFSNYSLWITLTSYLSIYLLAFVQLAMIICTLVFKFIISKKYTVKLGYEPVLLCLVSFLTIWVSPSLVHPTTQDFMRGFHERMEYEIKVPEVQNWLLTIEKPVKSEEYYIDPTARPNDPKPSWLDTKFIKSLDSPEWPKTIRSLNPHPKMVYIQPDKNQEAIIRLQWSTIASRWGIVIGPANMQIPESDMKHGGEYRLTLAPGAYVWYRIK
jgi:hypothetical protein